MALTKIKTSLLVFISGMIWCGPALSAAPAHPCAYLFTAKQLFAAKVSVVDDPSSRFRKRFNIIQQYQTRGSVDDNNLSNILTSLKDAQRALTAYEAQYQKQPDQTSNSPAKVHKNLWQPLHQAYWHLDMAVGGLRLGLIFNRKAQQIIADALAHPAPDDAYTRAALWAKTAPRHPHRPPYAPIYAGGII